MNQIHAKLIRMHRMKTGDILRVFATSMWIYACCYGMITVFTPEYVGAQTKFEWPDSRYDISHFKYIDVCVAVKKRVEDSIMSRAAQWKDTLHYTQYNTTTVLPLEVVSATKKCLTPFPASQISPKDALKAQELYLAADMDQEAKTIAERRLQAAPKDSTRLLLAAIDTIFEVYREAQPIRINALLDLYTQIEGMKESIPLMERIYYISMLVRSSREADDSVGESKAFAKMIALAKSLTEAEWADIPGQQLGVTIFFALRSQYHDRFSEALAQSTERFRALESELFTTLVGRPPSKENLLGSMMTKTGVSSPTVAGDYWFPANAKDIKYPRQGYVTLIVPVVGTDDVTILSHAAAIHRFKKRWPELDIVMIANTFGFFREIEPPPPEKEATYLDSVFRSFRDIPGVLSVTNTKFWRLPGYDRRRLNEATENEAVGRGSATGRGFARGHGQENLELIDREGKIVTSTAVIFGGDMSEKWLESLIAPLISRPLQKP